MNLTREQTIKALKCCIYGDQNSNNQCKECILNGNDCFNCCANLRVAALHYIEENEPAPSANDTSSKTKNTNITINNTPKSEICQEEIDTISCTNEVISGLKFMYPNAVIKRTMTDSDRCYVDFKCGNKNYSMCLSRDTYADKQED